MKLKDLYENNIITGQFGSNTPDDSGIDIPKGFSSFYTKNVGTNAAQIIGVRPDGTEKIVGTTQRDMAPIIAKHYNSGGKSGSGIRKVSLTQAFGSDFMKNLEQHTDQRMHEKPTDWQDITRTITQLDLRRMGINLPVKDAEDYFVDRIQPLADINGRMPETSIVVLPNGQKFIADRSGASSYARMWLRYQD